MRTLLCAALKIKDCLVWRKKIHYEIESMILIIYNAELLIFFIKFIQCFM